MDTPVRNRHHAPHTTRALGGMPMKKMHNKHITVGILSLWMTTVLFGTAAARADVVSDWNTIAVNTAVANLQNPFAQARYAALVQLAVFEAVNATTGEYQPYLGTITAEPGASAEAAASEAAYQVLNFYFSNSASTLLAAYITSLGQIPDGQAKTDGIAMGDAAAAALIALRANDGSSPPQTTQPGPPAPGA